MNKKLLITTVIFVCSVFFVNAQNFSHGVGLTFTSSNKAIFYNGDPINPKSKQSQFGLLYKLSNFKEIGDNKSIALSIYPSFSFSGGYGVEDKLAFNYSTQIPLVGELYFGDPKGKNFYIGAGLSYSSLKTTSFDDAQNYLGPQLAVGTHLKLGKHSLGVRLAYTQNYNLKISEADKSNSNSAVSLGVYIPINRK